MTVTNRIERICGISVFRTTKKRVLMYILTSFLFVAGTVIFVINYSAAKFDGMLCGVLIVLFANAVYCLVEFSARLSYLLFLLSLFCFMLGRITVDFFLTGSISLGFSADIKKHIFFSLFLSVFFLQIGYVISGKKPLKSSHHCKVAYNRLNNNVRYFHNLQSYSYILFVAASICVFIENLNQIFYVKNNSYVDIFTQYISELPTILHVIGNMYLISLFVYLSTCPPHKACILPIAIYFVLSITFLLTGDRGSFVINMVMVVIYVAWRQRRDQEVWIRKGLIIIGVLLLPLLMAGLSYFVYLRDHVDIGSHDFLSQFIRFFRSTGNSVDILGYEKVYQNDFPARYYSLGELVDYVKYNPISMYLFNYQKPAPHTTEYAMTMHSFAHTISYLVDSSKYLSGQGRGSSYIAEAYHDFGYVGLALCNVFYAFLLRRLNEIGKDTPIFTAYLFLALRVLYYVPRGSMIQPISYVLNISTIFGSVFLFLLARVPVKNKLWTGNG